MEEIDVKHIHVLEFPKQLLWTDRDLDYFLEEMPSEASRMNNDVYDVFIKEVNAGEDYSPEEAFNLAYYECVRISLAKYPESKDLLEVLEMDIQHHQSHVDYGFTNLIMNMVWAMLHSTGTAQRFTNKLHSFLVNSKKLKFWFRDFFTPNDKVHTIFPYEQEKEPRYNVKFIPCPKDMNYQWGKLTYYKEHLIEELLKLWPEDKREYVRRCIMEEKARNTIHLDSYTGKLKPPTSAEIKAGERWLEVQQLRKECDEWKAKYAELEKTLQARTDEVDKWHHLYEEESKRTIMVEALEDELSMWKKKCLDMESKQEPEKAFNAQTGKSCLTNTQMGILFQAVSELTETPPPGKTTLGDIVENIAGYSATTVNQNMKGAHRPKDISAIIQALGETLPNLTEKVKKL